MSYVAFATNAFEQVTDFYGGTLGFPLVAEWDRSRGRGKRFDLGDGLRLEILDNLREPNPVKLDVSQRVHVVVEVQDIQIARQQLQIKAPPPVQTSWGARLFQIHDPDGVPVTCCELRMSCSKIVGWSCLCVKRLCIWGICDCLASSGNGSGGNAAHAGVLSPFHYA